VAGVDNIPPDSPENLMAEADFSGPSVILTWDSSPSDGFRSVPAGSDFSSAGPSIRVNDVLSYNIRRSELGGEPELIAEVPAAVGYDSYSYTDETVESGITYDYSVTAVDGGGNESEAADSGPVAVGPPPVASISPEGEIDFGTVDPDSTTSDTVTITNVATEVGSVLGVEVSIEGDGFATDLADNEPVILGNDESVSFAVSFLASEVGNYNLDYKGTLTIRTNDPDKRETVIALSATIVGGMDPPVLALSRTGINFWNVVVDSSKKKLLTLTNGGSVKLEASIALKGGDSFHINHVAEEEASPLRQFGIDLEPGDDETYWVEFAPPETGDFRATIAVTSNDPRNPEIELDLLGSGVSELVCGRVELADDPETGEKVSVVGFIDDDNDIDYDDFFLFADVYGSTDDDDEYNPRADMVDCHNTINLDDFMKFADSFGYGVSN
ncbi:MAG: choice-of-anchor D domain-containing protein, partial [Gemmatimonadetes bacterium]|nr:choice-of-anchor D domain-containing protein [Gemmatimonadota bacterium]